jgi:hypothetical protein
VQFGHQKSSTAWREIKPATIPLFALTGWEKLRKSQSVTPVSGWRLEPGTARMHDRFAATPKWSVHLTVSSPLIFVLEVGQITSASTKQENHVLGRVFLQLRRNKA